jgi:hypothetical protein
MPAAAMMPATDDIPSDPGTLHQIWPSSTTVSSWRRGRVPCTVAEVEVAPYALCAQARDGRCWPTSAGRHQPPCSKRERERVCVCVCRARDRAAHGRMEREEWEWEETLSVRTYIPSAISGQYGPSKLQTGSTSLTEAGLLRGRWSFLVLPKMGCLSSKIDVYFRRYVDFVPCTASENPRGLSRKIIYVVVYEDNIKYYLNICIYLSHFKK